MTIPDLREMEAVSVLIESGFDAKRLTENHTALDLTALDLVKRGYAIAQRRANDPVYRAAPPSGSREQVREAEKVQATYAYARLCLEEACAIIELGDQRLLAGDGPAGGQPPELTLAEWRKLYVTLDKARKRMWADTPAMLAALGVSRPTGDSTK